MYTIREVSQKFDVTYDALRYYEKEGLLQNIQRDSQGRREYAKVDLTDLDKIVHLRRLGASVEETKQMLNLSRNSQPTVASCEQGLMLLDQLKNELNQRIATIEEQKTFLAEKTAHIQKVRDRLVKETGDK
ncbi:MerR family transcriptional regulator [Pediococcus ethanolidurans]|uniref:MerR family transcriptional regulator n=1 Tax=Pediococcus ethanolidurans TaxID=319653 RepID=UPI0021AA3241|nr:MerR family transcriptional regulator [Pediococcus ethanolidurans]MCT4397931.1 MerR family transcriptional regulator [Pediococcus ethanolidurans]